MTTPAGSPTGSKILTGGPNSNGTYPFKTRIVVRRPGCGGRRYHDPRGTAGYHISLDMDWVDPEDAPGVGTPVRGGATYREAHLAMEIIADHGRMLSFEIVEVNPVIDEHNQTADLAVELALSAFGKKIL